MAFGSDLCGTSRPVFAAWFLVLFRDFEASVLAENGEPKRRKRYFTDVQFEKLRDWMLAIDERALVEQGFWKQELG